MSEDKEISATKVRYVAEKATQIFRDMKHVAEEMLKLSQEDREWVNTLVQPEFDRINPEIDRLNAELERQEDEFNGVVRGDAECSSEVVDTVPG